jgi:group I intron endonuclease
VACIYVIEHVASKRRYVGQTIKPLLVRWQDHVSLAMRDGGSYIHHAICKYGPNAFRVRVLEECSVADLHAREIHYIALLKSNVKGRGFNLSAGGDGGRNSITPETRAKISKTKRGVKFGKYSAAHCEAIRQGKLASGYKHSPETIAKIKAKVAGRVIPPEVRAKISAGLRASRKFKLTAAQASEIRTLVASHSDNALARMFSISRRPIARIRAGTYEGPMLED